MEVWIKYFKKPIDLWTPLSVFHYTVIALHTRSLFFSHSQTQINFSNLYPLLEELRSAPAPAGSSLVAEDPVEKLKSRLSYATEEEVDGEDEEQEHGEHEAVVEVVVENGVRK